MERTYSKLVMLHTNRIEALANRWSKAFSDMNWPTTELKFELEEPDEESLSPKYYRYWLNAQITTDHKAEVAILIEPETDLADNGELVASIGCFTRINFGTMDSDGVT